MSEAIDHRRRRPLLGAASLLRRFPFDDQESPMQESSPNRSQRREPFSIPERELLGFVEAVSDLFGSGQSRFLREIWLDELASMETMPSPTSSEWRMVTLGAWARLANRLIDVPVTEVLDRSTTAAYREVFSGPTPKYEHSARIHASID